MNQKVRCTLQDLATLASRNTFVVIHFRRRCLLAIRGIFKQLVNSEKVWRLGRENNPGNSLFFPNPSHRLTLLPARFIDSLISGNCPLCLALSHNLSSGRKLQWWRLCYRWGTTKVSVLFSLIKKQHKMSVDNGATGCYYRSILYD